MRGGEENLGGCIVTADRGYSKECFVILIMDFGLCSVLIIPNNVLCCHPFVCKSYHYQYRCDPEEDIEEGQSNLVDVSEICQTPTPATATIIDYPQESYNAVLDP